MIEVFEFPVGEALLTCRIPSGWDHVVVNRVQYRRRWVRLSNGDERQEWVTVRAWKSGAV